MKIKFVVFLVVFVVGVVSIYAAVDLAKQKPIVVNLDMDEFSFKPNKLEFEIGKLYKLVVKNVGKVKHEVDAAAIAHFAYTRKIVVNDAKGKLMAEIKGHPAEVEVGAGYQLEWWFVPVSAVAPEEFVCLLPGHYEAGMKGIISFR